jgi:hypothetical protein
VAINEMKSKIVFFRFVSLVVCDVLGLFTHSASKSVFGTRQDVQNCNEELIGFTQECAACWTTDEICARDNCMFIYLQSVFTNQRNNFNVGSEDITSATCDEAFCGPEFVPCSGTTRRRMNIVSDIPRPVSQQCGVAAEDWAEIFDHP